MFSDVFTSLCDFCDRKYTIEWHKHVKTYHSCYECENTLHEQILEDEIKIGMLSVEKWYCTSLNNGIQNVIYMNHVDFTNDIDQNDYLPINGITNYFYGKTRRNSINKTDNLRTCDFIHIKNKDFNSLQICIEEMAKYDYNLANTHGKYIVHNLPLIRLSNEHFHLPIPILNNIEKIFNNKWAFNRGDLSKRLISLQKNIVKIFINNSPCIIILRIIGNRDYSKCGSLLSCLPKEIIENIIIKYLNLPKILLY